MVPSRAPADYSYRRTFHMQIVYKAKLIPEGAELFGFDFDMRAGRFVQRMLFCMDFEAAMRSAFACCAGRSAPSGGWWPLGTGRVGGYLDGCEVSCMGAWVDGCLERCVGWLWL